MAQDWASTLKLAELEQANGLPQGWLSRQIQVESGGNPQAVSPSGAQGLLQLMPATAKELGVIDPFDPYQNVEAAARYNGQLFKKYGGDPQKAAAAYNWGMGNVDRKGLDSAPEETRNYIKKLAGSLPEAGRQIASAFTNPIGTANAAEPDYSQLSDAELEAIAGGGQPSEPDYNALSDAQLEGIASGATNVGTVRPDGGSGDDDKRPKLGRKLQGPLEQVGSRAVNMLGDFGALPIADEIGGVVRGLSAASGLQGLIDGPGAPTTYDQGYSQGQDYINSIERQYEKENPNEAYLTSGLGIAGGGGALATIGKSLAGATASRVPALASMASNFSKANPKLAASILAATGGASQGGLAATGDDRLPSAIVGAGAGAVAGPVGSFLGNKLLGRAAKADAPALAKLAEARDAAVARERIDPTMMGEARLTIPASATNAVEIPAIINTRTQLGTTGERPVLSGEVVPVSTGKLTTATNETSEQAFSKARQGYDVVEQSGTEYSPEFADNVVAMARKEVPKRRLQRGLDKNNPVNKIVDEIEKEYAGKPITLQDVQDIDQFFTQELDSGIYKNQVTGRLNSLGNRLDKLQGEFRDMYLNASDDLLTGGREGIDAAKQARKDWARAIKLKTIEDIVSTADLYDQPANAIKNQLRSLLKNKKKINAYTESERELIRKAAESSGLSEIVRTLGSRLFPIGAMASGNPVMAAAAQGLSSGSRAAGTKLRLKKVDNIIGEINAPGRTARLKMQLNPTASVTSGQISGTVSANKKDDE